MTTFTELQAFVEDHTPLMGRIFRSVFHHYGAELAEEMAAEAIALTWKHLKRCWERGTIINDEGMTVFWRTTMQFSIRQVKTGRRAAGYHGAKPKDVYDLAWRSDMVLIRDGVRYLISDREPIPDAVAFAIDFDEWRKTLTNRQRAMLEDIVMSTLSNNELARKWEVSAGAVSQMRARLVMLYKRFVGD